MTTLIVTLPTHPGDAAGVFDYVLTADGSTVAEASMAPLALLLLKLPSPGTLRWAFGAVPK